VAFAVIGVGVIGFGYWGPQLARNFAALPGARLVAVCDSDEQRLAVARAGHPGVRCVNDVVDLLGDADIDAVAIATPVASHFEIARACLAAGKHVLVEKPLAASSDEARVLTAEAARGSRVLLVDHTYLYSSAVQSIHAAIASGDLGDVHYYDSVRTNLGRFRSDVDVLWDLASHDLAIVDYLFADAPTSVQAVGFATRPSEPCQLAYLTLRWGRRRIAHCHVSWLTPVKIRRTLIGGSQAMIVYDDLDPEAKIRIYEQSPDVPAQGGGSGPESEQLRIGFRSGAMRAPLLPIVEPLHGLVEHFIACITMGCTPRSDGHSGARVVGWLEAAGRSLAHDGVPIELPEESGDAAQ
jgi:predicted dehydrogenase